MNNLKFGVLICGLIAAVAWFIPANGVTFFAIWNAVDKSALIVLAGAVLAAVMGAMAIKMGMQRWMAVVALVGFGMFFVKFRAQIGEMFKAPLPGKLMVIATIAGLVFAILAAAKPEPAR